MIKAITKEEALNNRVFPDAVIQAFNELIVKGNGYVKQNAVIERIIQIDPSLTRGVIFDNRWLDIEKYYENAGWKVRYDKPGFCEDYEASWSFK